ncbi:hypothetical protein GCM10009119_16900 [Algoriphagus jejuensis]|uniref:Uncharacterized protein n=1 Tax=Algoriphagus jejuensis TaxID=419934 RepID=A0ABN1MZL3_9BACT
MKQIIPFLTFQEAIDSFDNGGRVYNLLSHAKDGIVSPAEMGKVAGVTHDPQAMILYFVLSISHLSNRDKERILVHLDTDLFVLYEKYQPVHMSLDQCALQGKAGISTMIVGTPKKISSTSEFVGSIMVPVIVDTVTSFTMVPIVTSYDVYELSSKETDKIVIIAHHKEKSPLPEKKLRIGGMLTSLSQSTGIEQPNDLFLEVQYYLEEE